VAFLLDAAPDGAVETVEWDYANNRAVVQRVSGDLQPIIDRNKERLNHGDSRIRTHDGMDARHVATVPVDVQYLWLQKYGICAWDKNHWPAVKRLLNSNEWRYLRTSELYL